MRITRGLSAVVFLLALLLSAGPARALPGDGASQLQAAGGFFHSQGDDEGNLNLDLSYAYYLTPGWELGLRQALNYDFRDDRRDLWNATTAPFLNYNFRLTNIIVPYLGAFIGAAWNDRDATGIVGPQGGIKFFVHNNVFLNLGYRYEVFFKRANFIDENSSHGNHVGNIGIGFTWGGAPS
jgi:hypothetical protein